MERLGTITDRLVAKLIAERELKEKPGSSDPKAEGAGSDLAGNERMTTRNAPAKGEDRGIVHARNGVRVDPAESTRGTGRGGACLPPPGASVIDWREHPAMILAWGHVRTPSPKSRRAKSGARSPR